MDYEMIKDCLWLMAVILLSSVAGYVSGCILTYFIRKFVLDEKTSSGKSFLKNCKNPLRLLFMVLGLFISLSFLEALGIPGDWIDAARHVLSIIIIFNVALLVIRFTHILNDVMLDRFNIDVKDNLRARKIHTQFRLFNRVIYVIVLIIAVGVTLMTFERIRQLGTSILASAGIAGLIIGIAAQRSLATLIAGMQIAVSQPIRIDDVVIVEGEWGRIEEITLTYVVVKIWDMRRLIVPITYFIEKSFQNWTRVSADLLGSVFLYVDYTVPVEAVREELNRILESNPKWDRKTCVLQVTNTTNSTVELRALMSASDASTAWNLRCEVREKLIGFLQEHYPQSLPRVRAEVSNALQDVQKAGGEE
ncbi:MAG: mechanosensitive ion channel [Sedimentisphaerales bacterium]|nr:mechanosensitive ion channel [Sedimentisphaerales bacterium]